MTNQGDNEVVLSARLEGFQEAMAALDELRERLASLNSGKGDVGRSPHSPGSSPPRYSTSSTSSYWLPAGALAPSAPGVNRAEPPAKSVTTPSMAPGGSPSGGPMTVSTLQIHATNVTVVGPGGAHSASTGQTGAMPGTPPPNIPTGRGGGGWGGGGWGGGVYQNVLQSFASRPSAGGLIGGIVGGLAGPAIGGFIGHLVVGGLRAEVEAQEPIFSTETFLMAQQAQGNYINPSMQMMMRYKAIAESNLTRLKLWNRILFGPLAFINRDLEREQERDIALIQAYTEKLGKQLSVVGWGGASDLTDNPDFTLHTRLGRMMRPYGAKAVRGITQIDFPASMRRTFVEEDIFAAWGIVAQEAQNPLQWLMSGLGSLLSSGVVDQQLLPLLAIQESAARGDIMAVQGLKPLLWRDDDLPLSHKFQEYSDAAYQRRKDISFTQYLQNVYKTAAVGTGAIAHLWGGPEQRYMHGLVEMLPLRAEIGLRESLDRNPLFSGTMESVQNRMALSAAQVTLQRSMEELTRQFYSLNTSVAQANTSIASTIQSTSRLIGIGGVAGVGYAAETYRASQSTVSAARAEFARLDAFVQSGRMSPSAPAYLHAKQQLLQAEQASVSAQNAMASVGLGVGITEREAQLSYTVGILSSMPGTYGHVRGALREQMALYEEQAGEISRQMQAVRAEQGGVLTPMQQHIFNEQLRSIGMKQAGAFQQLSYGWESRLMSMALNMPGSYAFISPRLAYRAAVGAGIRNPHMGSSGEDLPFFLRSAHMFGSIAGAYGTVEGFGVTAYTGALRGGSGAGSLASLSLDGNASLAVVDPGSMRSALQGMTVTIEMSLPNGDVISAPGRLRFGTQIQNTPAAIGEFATMLDMQRRNTQ